MIKSKPLIFLFGATAAGALTIRAQTAAPEPVPTPTDVSVEVTPAYVSQYMFRGQRLGGQSIQVPIEDTTGPWTVGIFADSPIYDTSHQSDPEIDYYGSYSFKLGSDFDARAGATLYTYPKNGLNGAYFQNMGIGEGYYRSTFEPDIGFDYTFAGLKLSPTYSYDTVLRGSNYELAVAYAIPLKDMGTELDFNGSTGYYLYSDASKIHNNVPEVRSKGDYWTLGASMPFQLARELKLTVGWAYDDGDGHLGQGAEYISNPEVVRRGVVSASLGYRF